MTRKTSIQPNKTKRNSKRKSESGNVFLFILIGIVLFAAISFVMSRGFRSEGTSKLTERQAELAADEILNYAQKMQRAYDRMRNRGCSENDISFESTLKPGYGYGSPDKCQMFNPQGGNMSLFQDNDNFNSSSAGFGYNIYKVGGTFRIDEAGESNRSELILYIGMFNPLICEKINEKLGVTNTGGGLPAVGGSHIHPSFIGTFDDPPLGWERFANSEPDLYAAKSGCFTYYQRQAGLELFFHTLLER